MQTLNVDLGDRSYPIYIGPGLLADTALWRQHIAGRQVMVVTNETIAPLYLSAVTAGLGDVQCDHVILPDGEQHKTLAVVETIYDALLQQRHNRSTTLIALGGGVVGDMTGFAAATYQRGVDFIQVPTTLLSQVDSSVGGKTGVNHPLGKNMIGAFYQPRCVLIDTDTLSTLPPREYAAGIAEVIKYGLISDAEFYQWLQQHMQALLQQQSDAVSQAVYRSCDNKARVVAADEREGGIRAILNLGHTFGHAIEALQGYGNWLHGEAVAAGMVMAVELSQRLGWVKPDLLESLRALLQQANLPTAPPALPREQFLALMAVDKKVLDGRLRLVLLQDTGKAVVTSEVPLEALQQTLSAFAID